MIVMKKDERGRMDVNAWLLGRCVMQELDSVQYSGQIMQELDSMQCG